MTASRLDHEAWGVCFAVPALIPAALHLDQDHTDGLGAGLIPRDVEQYRS